MTITLEEITAYWPALLERVAEGEQVTITRQGIPFANVVPVPEAASPPDDDVIGRIKQFRERQVGGKPHIRELIQEGRQH